MHTTGLENIPLIHVIPKKLFMKFTDVILNYLLDVPPPLKTIPESKLEHIPIDDPNHIKYKLNNQNSNNEFKSHSRTNDTINIQFKSDST